MSITFDSPTQMSASTEAYFTPLNMPNLPKEESNTPYYTAPINPSVHQEFLNAIQARHASQPIILSTTTPIRRNLPTQATILSSIDPTQLNQLLNSSLLLVDVRSFVQYSHANIRKSINVSIPNTILKRPTFTLDKVYEAMASESARKNFQEWGKFEAIVFYDQQSNVLQENSASAYLGHKLIRAGFKGKLHFLKGGFEAFSLQYKESCETTTANKPSNGFQLSLPTQKAKPHLKLSQLANPGPFTAPRFENQTFNPFFSNIRQNMELSHGPIRERFPIRLPLSCQIQKDKSIQFENPIKPRWGQPTQSYSPPSWLQSSLGEDGTQLLAETYERIERTEQRRLQNIMHFHSKHTDCPAEYPFSIVAGIEMGALNRYTNIWPYEYTRVKIKQSKGSDYINASYIQYIKSDETVTDARPDQVQSECVKMMKENRVNQPYRRYISTQGPLPATFQDFWQMVWEQNTHVLVMLTKEEEMNKIKCHRYWPNQFNTPTQYGDVTITLTSESKIQIQPLDQEINEEDAIITRHLTLTYGNQTREIVHLQYTGWMDFGVPDTPLGTLEVIQLANVHQKPEHGPMIVHCSAGCGRSGAFCTIDTVLNQLEQASSRDVVLDTISRFREQRLSMVQTLRQFVFCYEAIGWWLLGYGPDRIQNPL